MEKKYIVRMDSEPGREGPFTIFLGCSKEDLQSPVDADLSSVAPENQIKKETWEEARQALCEREGREVSDDEYAYCWGKVSGMKVHDFTWPHRGLGKR